MTWIHSLFIELHNNVCIEHYGLLYLFNDAFSSSDYTPTTEWMINEWWSGKDVEAVVAKPTVLPRHLPGGTDGNHEKHLSR
jgi:hypothetical protein